MASNEISSKINDELTSKKYIEKAGTIWTINNFSLCKDKTGEFIKSLNFHSKTDDKVKWYLQLYPKGYGAEDKDYISLYLNIDVIDNVDVTTMWNFYVLNQEGEKEYVVFSNKVFNKIMKREGYPQFLKRDLLLDIEKRILVNDTLVLGCSVFYFCSGENTVNTSTINNINEPLNMLLNDFGNLFELSKFADCIIKVGDSIIDVHKCILASRSEVFDKILTDKNYESDQNIIEINEFSLEAVKEMIKYLYTGKLPNIDEMALEMLAIGDKYKLKQLKSEAEESLIRSLNIDNVCDYIVQSDLYSTETLKEWCLQFIYLNSKVVTKSVEWEKVVANHPLLVAKLLNFFC